MVYAITENKGYGDWRYDLTIGRSKWGLKSHHINPNFYYAVPRNNRSKKMCVKKSPFRDIWFHKNHGKWTQTTSPAVWVQV